MTDNKDKVKVPGELISAGKYPVVSTDEKPFIKHIE